MMEQAMPQSVTPPRRKRWPELLPTTLVVIAILALATPTRAAVPADAIHKGIATNTVPRGRDFWSFQPLKAQTPPSPRDRSWGHGPIDQFIRARQEAIGVHPNKATSRQKLVRRLYLDVLGLPPTPAQVERFVSDRRPDAVARLVDSLLESPHYGERWGRHWLDLARFGESHGFEHDTDRPNAYHYRDFVIEALNRDMPFDQFVRWQIAGDELAPDDLLAWKATGFLAAGTHATQITANQAEKERYDELDDIVSTIGTSMLGLSLGCARCHDHKYDPVSTTDYYRMIATFTKTVRSDYELPVDPEGDRKAHESWSAEHAAVVGTLTDYERAQLPKRFAEWEPTGRPPAIPTWLVLDAAHAASREGATFTTLDDGSFLATGKSGAKDIYTFTTSCALSTVTAIRLEALADPSMVRKGPGRAENGNFQLTEFRASIGTVGSTQQVDLKFASARATFEQKGLPVAAAIDADPNSGWAIDPQFGTNHAALFTLASPLTGAAGKQLTITLKFEGNTRHTMGRVRLAVTGDEAPGLEGTSASMAVADAARALARPRAERSAEEIAAALRWFRTQDPEWRKLHAAVDEHARREPALRRVKVLVSSEGLPPVRLNTQGPDFYDKTYLLKRGDLSKKEGEASPGFLPVLMRASSQESTWQHAPPEGSRTPFRRAALAAWITDQDRGAGALLARVIVNRLWQHHFGQGIVGTPSDFGAQGARPTHPELLDWLAGELIRGGWRLKPIHRLILCSATYGQSAEADDARSAKDVSNATLWHFPRQRLDAEVIRDSLLAVSGRLDPRLYGPGTLDESMTRRSIYFTVKRSQLIPMMVQFDAPDGLQGLGRRVNTTVAPQGLLMMNNGQVRACSREFAKRLEASEPKSAEARVRAAFLTALGRTPSKSESVEAANFIREQAQSYGGADAGERALADFCQVLFGLNEFLYVD
jgi:hypothetical protein